MLKVLALSLVLFLFKLLPFYVCEIPVPSPFSNPGLPYLPKPGGVTASCISFLFASLGSSSRNSGDGSNAVLSSLGESHQPQRLLPKTCRESAPEAPAPVCPTLTLLSVVCQPHCGSLSPLPHILLPSLSSLFSFVHFLFLIL